MIAPQRYQAGFAAACRRLRRASGLSQERVAELAGVSVDSVRRHERGGRAVTLEIAARLVQAFDVQLAEVIAGIEGEAPDSPERLAAIEQLRRLDGGRLDVAVIVLRALAELS